MVRKEVDIDGTIIYRNEQGHYHREDGPALEFDDGTKYWYINDLCHREDGPAEEYPDGYKVWYLMGKLYSYEDWLAIKDYPLLW